MYTLCLSIYYVYKIKRKMANAYFSKKVETKMLVHSYHRDRFRSCSSSAIDGLD